MNFEFLAQEHTEAESARWSWQSHASHLRRDVTKPEDLTGKRTTFLIRHAMTLDGVSMNDALADTRKAKGKAKSLACPTQELDQAKLLKPAFDVTRLPAFSAAITLQFQLLTPLLTRDDDPFYLFDNPVRKDHVFGVAHLAGASLKGLASDAFQRGFPHEAPWNTLGIDDQKRTMRYRSDNEMAQRLFGNASDDPDAFSSQAGRLHFSPIWFSHVEYLVMNPTKSDGSGIGTLPIHFEAVASVDERGKPAKADASFFYFNPAGAKDADETTARTDLACLVGALAAWWPTLGLGAKRLAGYGAIEPLAALCHGTGYADMEKPLTFSGTNSWKQLAQRIAQGKA
jgi:hypothetical protein